MKRLFLLTVMGCLFALSGYPQQLSLPIPLNIQKAYDGGSRAYDGRPGEKYWQNRADYRIQATIDPATQLLTGSATIRYQNNSPATLSSLTLRLYQNLYRAGSASDIDLPESAMKEGVEIHALWFGKDTVDLTGSKSPFMVSGTLMTLSLPAPLPSGDSVEFGIAWAFTLPESKDLRMGKYGENALFFAYWYPQVSVYDDIQGWDRIPFTGLQEFYTDFGDFEVELTVPKDFIVWATGVFQNPEEVLAEPYLGRYRAALDSDEVLTIIGKEDVENKGFTPDQEQLTWKFKAEYVPDFAFGTSDRYRWEGSSVVVDSASGRRVFADACYPVGERHFSDVAAVAARVLQYLSQKWPGLPFPYPKITLFNGMNGGGMEYPMMANDAATSSSMFTVSLTCHEIAHTYFPFYTGINERKYAWIDEGLASFLPGDLLKEMGLTQQPLRFDVMQYANAAGKESDLPLMTPSYQLRSGSYYLLSYAKAPIAFQLLRDDMGDDRFKAALQAFIERWKGKHPTPFDLFFTFNDVAGEDYAWFWKPWFFDYGAYPDLALEESEIKGKSGRLLIRKVGQMPVPIHLTINLEGSKQKVIHLPISVWREGNDTYEMKLKFEEAIRSIRLGDAEIPDVNMGNNSL